MPRRYATLLGVIFCASLLAFPLTVEAGGSLSLKQQDPRGQSEDSSVAQLPESIKGKVVAKAKDSVTLRQPSGQEISLILDSNRVQELGIGDEIEAKLQADGRATSFNKLRSGEVGGGQSSSGTTGHQSLTDVPAK